MKDRFRELRRSQGLSQEDFAKRLGLTSRGKIANIELGKIVPDDDFLALVCERFSVNEEWLRTGTGAMDADNKNEAEIAAFIGDVLGSDHADFRRKLITVLSRLDPQQWHLIQDMAEKLLEEMQAEQAEEQKEAPGP